MEMHIDIGISTLRINLRMLQKTQSVSQVVLWNTFSAKVGDIPTSTVAVYITHLEDKHVEDEPNCPR